MAPKRITIPAHPNNYRNGRRQKIVAVVLHDMESSERLDTAENVGAWFARADHPPSSAHKGFDSDSIVRYVDDFDEAYHAPPASRWSLGYEQAGVARQSAAEWHDPYSWAMLQNVAAELAADAKRHGIPLVIRSIDDLKAGRIDGVYQHNAVSKAFGRSSHWDCGPGYPEREVVAMASKGAHTVPPPPATVVLRPGAKGESVAFMTDMMNIMAKVGFTKNAQGQPSTVQIPVPKAGSPNRRVFTYGNAVQARVTEIQRWAHGMWVLAGRQGKAPTIDGLAGPEFATILSFYVPIALKKVAPR